MAFLSRSISCFKYFNETQFQLSRFAIWENLRFPSIMRSRRIKRINEIGALTLCQKWKLRLVSFLLIFLTLKCAFGGQDRQIQRTIAIVGRITVWLVSSLTRLDLIKDKTMLLFVCRKEVESNLVILETSRTVILHHYGECSLVHLFTFI